MPLSPYKVSKTGFLKYDQCPKAFFFYKNFPYLRDPISKEKQFTFNRGHEVGYLAQHLFPNGIDVSRATKNSFEAYELTQKLIADKRTTIYEATFIYNEVLVMVDILHFEEGEWKAYEVKSSLKISETYLKDACLQYYVLKNKLPAFDDLFLVTLNGDYRLTGTINVHELFKKRSIKVDGEKNLDFFSHALKDINLLLEKNKIPDIKIGKQCFSPYTCDFFGTCWKNAYSEKSVFNIGKIDKEQLFNWYNNGITTVDKIESTSDLKEHTILQIESIKSNQEYFDKKQINYFLSKIDRNVCFLDMEIWSPAIPKFEGHKPFEQLPFLFSVIHQNNEEIISHHYMIPEKLNDLEQFAKELISYTKQFNSVIVFDKNLEIQVIDKLSNIFSDLNEELEVLKTKIIDLAELIQNYTYYHPKFKGNFSLKVISELFSEQSDYANLEIQSGIIAMYKYESLFTESNPILVEDVKQQLIDYCHTDTITCLKFLNYLKEKLKE